MQKIKILIIMSRVYPVLLFISLILFTNQKIEFSALEFPSDNWNLDSTNGVYYQLQLQYCTKITSSKYQSMGLYVPKEYLTCTENSGKYKCEVNKSGKKGSYTAANAPIVMPVDTPGYAAMEALLNIIMMMSRNMLVKELFMLLPDAEENILEKMILFKEHLGL